MKKTMIWMSGVILSCSLMFSACEKEKTPSRSEMITGTWAVNAFGEDDNMNGSLEENEYNTIPAGASLVITMRTDNTGVATLDSTGKSSVTQGFTWQLINNEQDLRITTNTGSVSTAHIAKLTPNQLQGYDQASNPRFIIDLRK